MNWYYVGSAIGGLIMIGGIVYMIVLKKTNRWNKSGGSRARR